MSQNFSLQVQEYSKSILFEAVAVIYKYFSLFKINNYGMIKWLKDLKKKDTKSNSSVQLPDLTI